MVAHMASRYRSIAETTIAIVRSTAVRVQGVEAEAIEFMLPSLSNGLPPPLLSFIFVCESPLEGVEVEVADGTLEVSTRIPLLDPPSVVEVDEDRLVAVAVPLRTADEEDAGADEVVSVDEGVVEVELASLLDEGFVVVASLVVVGALLSELAEPPPSTASALEHNPLGPPPERKVVMMLLPSIPLFPQALFTLDVKESSASIQLRLQASEAKSEAEQPLMDCVYTVWQLEGRSDTRGVKSESETATMVAGSASSASVGCKNRIVVELKGRQVGNYSWWSPFGSRGGGGRRVPSAIGE